MRAALGAAALCLLAAALLLRPAPGRVMVLPAGTVEITAPIEVPAGTEVRGAPEGTVIRAADAFRGRALFVCRGARRVSFADFTVDGNRAALEQRTGLPPYDVPFAKFTEQNGLLIEDSVEVSVRGVRFVDIAGFAILVSRSRAVAIAGVEIADSGSRNAAGRNNTTGGILIEEATAEFSVRHSRLRGIRGNGIWTHSLYTSPRSRDGVIAGNLLERIGRDAIQVGHATGIRVEENRGSEIGFPLEDVNLEEQAIPVAIDTAGDVDRTVYARNHFSEINGKCFDLDGFHDGAVRDNVCVNRGAPERYPAGGYAIVMNNTNTDMRSQNIVIEGNRIDGSKFGGVFVIGSGHRVVRNRLLHLNLAGCPQNAARFGCYYLAAEPDLLRSGIYLGRGAERPAPARGNVIADNEITGHGMQQMCVTAAPGIAAGDNQVRGNRCRGD